MSLVIRCLVACFACVSFLLVSSLNTPDAAPTPQPQVAQKEAIGTQATLARKASEKEEAATAALQ